jgi:isoquinoline 1-oxidoreductase alpha subunit
VSSKSIAFTLNGKPTKFAGDPDTPLLWALRDHFGLTGTKYGCGMAQCGACTVHIDGTPSRSCITPVGTVAGQKITTIEGVNGKVADAVIAAWVRHEVPQCGFCQSGQVMSAIGLLASAPDAGDAEIDAGMRGNICRCATYVRIRRAIKDASKALTA